MTPTPSRSIGPYYNYYIYSSKDLLLFIGIIIISLFIIGTIIFWFYLCCNGDNSKIYAKEDSPSDSDPANAVIISIYNLE